MTNESGLISHGHGGAFDVAGVHILTAHRV
jgi:hypothetical protein